MPSSKRAGFRRLYTSSTTVFHADLRHMITTVDPAEAQRLLALASFRCPICGSSPRRVLSDPQGCVPVSSSRAPRSTGHPDQSERPTADQDDRVRALFVRRRRSGQRQTTLTYFGWNAVHAQRNNGGRVKRRTRPGFAQSAKAHAGSRCIQRPYRSLVYGPPVCELLLS